MIYQLPGKHYDYLKNYEHRRHMPYDYKKNGIINKMMSPIITNTKNKTTKLVLNFVEAVAQFLVEYVGELKNFKNPYYHRY